MAGNKTRRTYKQCTDSRAVVNEMEGSNGNEYVLPEREKQKQRMKYYHECTPQNRLTRREDREEEWWHACLQTATQEDNIRHWQENSHLTTTRTRVKLLDVTMILLSKIRLEEQTDRGESPHH